MVFSNEDLPDDFVIAARDACRELVDHYDESRVVDSDFPAIISAFLGIMSDATWKRFRTTLSPKVTIALTVMCARKRLDQDPRRARKFLQYVLDAKETPISFRNWATAKLREAKL